MNDSQKTKKQLIEELAQIRRELASTASSKNRLQKNTPEPTESGNIFYKAFLTSPDMFIITNSSDGTYLEVNDSFVKNTGYSRDELIGHTVDDVNLWAYQEEHDKMNRLLAEKGKLTDEEFSFRMKSGEIRRWLCSAEIVNMNGTDHMIAVATDVTERKRAEEALRESEEKYRAVIENANIGIIVVQDNRLVFCNPWICEMLDYTEDELYKNNVMSFVHPDDKLVIGEQMKDFLIGKPASNAIEMRVLSKSGEIMWINGSSVLIQWQGKPAIQSFIIDITERKKIEEELRESEEKFSKAFFGSPDAMTITSVDTGLILELNQGFERVFEYSREEAIGNSTLGLNIWKDPSERERMVFIVKQEGYIRDFSAIGQAKSGRLFDCEVSSEFIEIKGESHLLTIARDVTERKRAEDALRESEEKFRALVESTDDFVWEVDVNGVYTYCSPKIWELWGYTPEESIGKTPFERMIPEDRERFVEVFRTISESQGPFKGMESSSYDKNGHVVIIETSGVPFYDADGRLLGYRGTSRDITKRKLAEEALRESEARFRTLYDTMAQGVVYQDVEGKIISANPAAERILGLTLEQMQGRTSMDPHWKSILEDGSDFPGEQHPAMESLRTGQPVSGVVMGVYHPVEDEYRWIIIDSVPEFRKGEDTPYRVYTTFTDITGRKRTREILRQSEEKFSKAFHSSPDMITLINLESGKYVEVNDSYISTTGYTREELIGYTRDDVNIWASQEDEDKMGRLMAKSSKIRDQIFHIRTKSGEIRTWQCSADIIDIGGAQCLLGVAADITERIRAEEALRESEAQLQGILRAAPIGIALIQDDIALWVNDYMSILTGYSAKELVGLNARKLCTSDEEFVRVGKLKVQNIKKYGKSEIESKLVCKNGKIIDLLIISTPLDPEDLSAGEIATMMDITERKKAEEQEREAKNLRELDKLRTELLANVSHELRTPLASIKGFTTVLTDYEKKPSPEEKREYLEIIDHNTDRLSELIEQLLVMSRLGAGMLTIDRSPSDISKLCQEVISEAKIRSPEYQFALNLPAKLPRVHIDTKRIRQVLDNLIDNAVKHSSAGTEISIDARKSNGEILISVTDEGTGISRKDKPHIFDRMFHAERNHQPGVTGAGLGLSICKGLIEAHKGRIWIESEEGKGTRCFFTLPTYIKRGVSHGKKDKGQYHSVRRG